MKIALKILVGIVGLFAAFVLLIGLISLWGSITLSRSSPRDIGDTEWYRIKIEKVTPKATSTQLRAEGYPTIFVAASKADGQSLSGLIRQGDQISVRLKTEIAAHLESVESSYVYGLQLSNGMRVLEKATPIPTPGMRPADFAKLIGMPAGVLILIFSWRIWFGRAKTAFKIVSGKKTAW